MKEICAMICGTAVVIVALVLDGATAQAMAAAFVGAGGFLSGWMVRGVKDEAAEVQE